jgi:hypothetical protein
MDRNKRRMGWKKDVRGKGINYMEGGTRMGPTKKRGVNKHRPGKKGRAMTIGGGKAKALGQPK